MVDKQLIVQADDFGMCLAINEAIEKLLFAKAISSASVMAPCAWAWDAIARASAIPDVDLGVHLTLTSEWGAMRWRPIATGSSTCGLVDLTGAFHAQDLDISASRDVVFSECLGQVRALRNMGMHPTHIDSHMFSMCNDTLVHVYREVSKTECLPMLLPRRVNGRACACYGEFSDTLYVDDLLYVTKDVSPDAWSSHYLQLIKELRPGVTVLLAHPGFDTSELRSISGVDTPWGAAWRQRDYDFLSSAEFRVALRDNQVSLVSWREMTRVSRD